MPCPVAREKVAICDGAWPPRAPACQSHLPVNVIPHIYLSRPFTCQSHLSVKAIYLSKPFICQPFISVILHIYLSVIPHIYLAKLFPTFTCQSYSPNLPVKVIPHIYLFLHINLPKLFSTFTYQSHLPAKVINLSAIYLSEPFSYQTIYLSKIFTCHYSPHLPVKLFITFTCQSYSPHLFCWSLCWAEEGHNMRPGARGSWRGTG